jgi:hypothetical protein
MLACMTETKVRPTTRPAPRRQIAQRFETDLSASVLAAGTRLPNVRQISERVAMGRALWRELVIGFASQLGELRLGFTQLAALYVLADGSTLTIGELAESINRSPSATSRLIDGLVKRRLVERRSEEEDRRQKVLRSTLEPIGTEVHDSAGSDPEREWDRGHVYICTSCEERVRVIGAATVPDDQGRTQGA